MRPFGPRYNMRQSRPQIRHVTFAATTGNTVLVPYFRIRIRNRLFSECTGNTLIIWSHTSMQKNNDAGPITKLWRGSLRLFAYIHIYTYTHTHTHTHIYIYIYILHAMYSNRLFWAPVNCAARVNPQQLIWGSGTHRWNLQIPDLQITCRDFSTWEGCQNCSLSNGCVYDIANCNTIHSTKQVGNYCLYHHWLRNLFNI